MKLAVRRVLNPAALVLLAALGTALAASSLVFEVQAQQPATTGDRYLCYKSAALRLRDDASAGLAFVPQPGVAVADALTADLPGGTRALDVISPAALCRPAAPPGGGPQSPAISLASYRARLTRLTPPQTRPVSRVLEMVSELGTVRLRVGGPDRLAMPSSIAPGAGGAPPVLGTAVPPFACYAARVASSPSAATPRFAPGRVTLTDATGGPRVLDLRRPTRLCSAARVEGEPAGDLPGPDYLLCLQARLASTTPRQAPPARAVVSVANRLGSEVVTTGGIVELCVPAQNKAAIPTPTVTPTPGVLVELRVEPASRAAPPGESAHFIAFGLLSSGQTQNFTKRVVWSSSDPAIATISNEEGEQGRATGHEPGWVTITAVHPRTGIGSTDSGKNGVFNVIGELESISLSPAASTVRVGAPQTYKATGHYTRGATQNITQQLVYTSSDPAVAAAPNTEGQRSRIETLAPGTVTISAVDPVTGIGTTDSGGDAALTVLGPVERLTLIPGAATRQVGQSLRYTATAHFPGGVTLNLTQEVTYASTNPQVAAARNTAGDRSRVDALRAGTVTISAVDPVTGASTAATGDNATLTVTGGLERITLAPASAQRAVGGVVNYVATGHYGDGTTRNLTQQVVYASSKPRVARAPNADGNRSRVEAVGQGTARISATDPVTGVSSATSGGDATLKVVP